MKAISCWTVSIVAIGFLAACAGPTTAPNLPAPGFTITAPTSAPVVAAAATAASTPEPAATSVGMAAAANAPEAATEAALLSDKIQHVVIIMQENRSFDEYFGTYPGADGIPMQNGIPTVCVPDPTTQQCVRPYHNSNDVNAGGPHAGRRRKGRCGPWAHGRLHSNVPRRPEGL